MRSVPGNYFDGRSSDRRPVTITQEGEMLRIVGEGLDLHFDRQQVRLSAPLGQLRRTLFLPDGGVCEVAEGVEALLPQATGRAASWLHRWERSLGLALAALLLTVGVVWGFLHFGVPLLAKRLAFALPPASETVMGEEALHLLDRLVFAPTALPHERREQLQTLFAAMQRELPETEHYRLELRAGKQLGANALALPAGIIVVTDEFVNLAQHDDEIVAVLAHEFSHARQRHILRHVLQSSATGVIVASLTGDLTSITSLAATLPTALIDARYSRNFETEADDGALAYLKGHDIPPSRFADILQRLQSDFDKRSGAGKDSSQPLGDLFSTHPETEARIRHALGDAAP